MTTHDVPALLAEVERLREESTANRAIFAKYVGELHQALLDNERLTAERDQLRAALAEQAGRSAP